MGRRAMNMRAGWGVLAVVSLLALTGCGGTAGAVASGKTARDDQGARILEKKVVFNSIGLKMDIEIVDIKSSLAGNLMRAQAALRSRDSGTLSFQYRFEWYDADGLEINSGAGSWRPLLLNGKEIKTVQGVAPDQRAKEFKLLIRQPD